MHLVQVFGATRKRLSAVKREVATVKSAATAYKIAVATDMSQLESTVMAMLLRMKHAAATHAAEKGVMEKEIRSLKSEMAGLSNESALQATRLQAQIFAHKTRADEAELQMQNLNARHSHLQVEHAQLQSTSRERMEMLSADLCCRENDVAALRARHADLASSYAQTRAALADSRALVTTREATTATLQSQLSAIQGRIDGYAADADAAKGAADHATRHAQVMTALVQSLGLGPAGAADGDHSSLAAQPATPSTNNAATGVASPAVAVGFYMPAERPMANGGINNSSGSLATAHASKAGALQQWYGGHGRIGSRMLSPMDLTPKVHLHYLDDDDGDSDSGGRMKVGGEGGAVDAEAGTMAIDGSGSPAATGADAAVPISGGEQKPTTRSPSETLGAVSSAATTGALIAIDPEAGRRALTNWKRREAKVAAAVVLANRIVAASLPRRSKVSRRDVDDDVEAAGTSDHAPANGPAADEAAGAGGSSDHQSDVAPYRPGSPGPTVCLTIDAALGSTVGSPAAASSAASPAQTQPIDTASSSLVPAGSKRPRSAISKTDVFGSALSSGSQLSPPSSSTPPSVRPAAPQSAKCTIKASPLFKIGGDTTTESALAPISLSMTDVSNGDIVVGTPDSHSSGPMGAAAITITAPCCTAAAASSPLVCAATSTSKYSQRALALLMSAARPPALFTTIAQY